METLTFARLLHEARFLRTLGYNRHERMRCLFFLCYGLRHYSIQKEVSK